MMHNHYFYNCNYYYHSKSIILQEQKNPNNQKCNIEIFYSNKNNTNPQIQKSLFSSQNNNFKVF